jgi:2-polyprenyl-3-methyl-5-hydroxy-6-metoxy-1,4-benzoquinol methylase
LSIDTTADDKKYRDFYEKIGSDYPETRIVHNYVGVKSRFQAVLGELKRFASEGASLIDIGCNNGVYTIPYGRMGGSALGVDISPSLIKQAKMRTKGVDSVRFEVMDIQAELDAPQKFDVVLMSEVFEHLTDPEAALRNVHKLLKKGGTLVFTVPTPLFEVQNQITFQYARNVLSDRLIVEHQTIDSSNNALSDFGLSGFLYRHDAYYPLGLKRFVESFGFTCVKCYTINFTRKPFMFLVPISFFEFFFRKLPFVKLFGITAIQVYKKKEKMNGAEGGI